MKTLKLFAITSALIGLLVFSQQSVACSCERLTQEELADRADYIFFAQVTAGKLGNYLDDENVALSVLFEFEVIETFKGNPRDLDNLVVERFSNCEVSARLGDYLFVQTSVRGHLSTCSGNRNVGSTIDGHLILSYGTPSKILT
jgi:hypothetical protein